LIALNAMITFPDVSIGMPIAVKLMAHRETFNSFGLNVPHATPAACLCYTVFMPEVLADIEFDAPLSVREVERVEEARADMVSPCGALILAVTIIMTLVTIFSIIMPRFDGMQTFIVVFLTLACWGFLLNSFTERLRLKNGVLEYRAIFGRSHHHPITNIRGFKLTDLGLSLNGVQYQLELQLADDTRPAIISLGACWQRRQLMKFARTISMDLEALTETI